MPTHAHGQGYSDINFLIPELVSGIQYRKGTYSAEDGDFAAAGATYINYRNTVEGTLVEYVPGEDGYQRAFVATSPRIGSGHLLAGLELLHNDGPWETPDGYEKINGLLRYSRGTASRGFSVTAMGYDGAWDATDQVPARAVESGSLGRFGTLDPTCGGTTVRYSLSGEYQALTRSTLTKASAYLLHYKLNLFSNFTYLLDDPVNGDQFEQADDRVVSGLRASHRVASRLGGRDVENTIGLAVRHDNIANVGLYRTRARARLSTTRQDHVLQSSASPFVQSDWHWNDWLRAIVGLRADLYRFEVTSANPLNSGDETSSLVSPKLSLILGPWSHTEYFVNFGYGFHSNDARGATIREDPVSGDPVDRVDPLVRAEGAELGVRAALADRFTTALSLWNLDIDSELLFIGDAGNTEATRPSRRTGVEWTNVVTPRENMTIDADVAFTRARFRDDDPAGDRIPGAVAAVAAGGVAYHPARGPFAGLRLRHVGARSLIEDDSVRSKSSTVLNAQLGYRFRGGLRVGLDVFNLLDEEVSDIDYFYASRLAGEADEGVEDVHTHPQQPRTLRLILAATLP
jgi:outer membrane receptor protein involved in Fe transport